MFSGTEPFQAGQELTWSEMEWDEMMFWSTFQFFFFFKFHLSLKARRNYFPKLSTIKCIGSPYNGVLFTSSGCVFLVCFPFPQNLRQCSGYTRYFIKVLLPQLLPTLSLQVSFTPDIYVWNQKKNDYHQSRHLGSLASPLLSIESWGRNREVRMKRSLGSFLSFLFHAQTMPWSPTGKGTR